MAKPAFGTAKLARPKALAMAKMAVPKAPPGMAMGAPPPMRMAIPKIAPGMSPLASKLKGVPM